MYKRQSFDYKRETTPWLHPGISAAVYCGDKRLGVFGKLSNEINGELEIAKDQKDNQNIYCLLYTSPTRWIRTVCWTGCTGTRSR